MDVEISLATAVAKHGSSGGAFPFHEQLNDLVYEGRSHREAEFAGFVLKKINAPAHDRAMYEIALPASGGGSWPWREGEGVDVKETRSLDDIKRFLKGRV